MNKLVKLGCFFCILFQSILYFFLIMLLLNFKPEFFLIFKSYDIKITKIIKIIEIEEIEKIFEKFYFVFFFLKISFSIFLYILYIRLFNAKSNKFTKILCGIYGLFWGLFPGIFILFGSYQKKVVI